MKAEFLLKDKARGAKPLTLLARDEVKTWLTKQSGPVRAWVKANDFTGKARSLCLVPDGKGGIARVVAGIDRSAGHLAYAHLPESLPAGTYKLEGRIGKAGADAIALGWALGGYRFERFRKERKEGKGHAQLLWPESADRGRVEAALEAIFLVRDLINTPAGDLGPAELATAARDLARRHAARCSIIVGDRLLSANYPAIHAVGRASSRAPRLIDIAWGKRGPRVTLIGKGVCFDSGGLDLKSASNMLLMKKDMGGAAQVLGLAHMIMAARLPLRLRVLVPAVENSVSGNAMRPLDVLPTRQGKTVEVGNTDAEGRLILCDALAEACVEKPDLLIDFATLTGAARVALGTEVPALFSNDDKLAASLLKAGEAVGDPLWRLPLVARYRRQLDSKVADINSTGNSGFAGAILAALFLQDFVADAVSWAHIDLMAWNVSAEPGRPVGGEAMGIRAAFAVIEDLARGGRKSRG